MLGAIIGDIAGSIYEFTPVKSYDFPLMVDTEKKLFFTDDTVLTIAIADALMNNKNLPVTVANYCRAYPFRGYGGNFSEWIYSDLAPYGSYGNGSAMRVSSVGYIGKDEKDVLRLAKKTSVITHDHIEGIKGAQSIALAIHLAKNGASKDTIKRTVESTFGYNLSKSLSAIEANYGFDETCQGSVPEAFVAFLESSDYESAIRNAIWLKGDADTQACIAGGIAEAFYQEIPEDFKEKALALLDERMLRVLQQFSMNYVELGR